MSRPPGWYRLSRKMHDGEDPFWSEDREFSRWEAWVDLIQKATWRDREQVIDGELVQVERGQLIASQRFLAERWNWSTGKVRRYLELLVDLDRIEWKTNHPKNHLGAIITLVNYDKYQADPSDTNRVTNHQRTTNEPPTNQSRSKLNELNKVNEQQDMGVADRNGDRSVRFPHPNDLPKEGGQYLYPDPFEAFWRVYPERRGSNTKLGAYRKWRSIVLDGTDPSILFEAATTYRSHVESEGQIGTQYVMQAKTFLGPDEHWRQAWDDQPEPTKEANRRAMKNYRSTLEAITAET